MRWDVAHRVASIAAAHAHRDYGIDRSTYVDVFEAIRAAGIDCVAQPAPRLLGMYVDPGDGGPAIWVNSGQGEIGIRHSAAHELGHHTLGHSSRCDEDPFAQWGNGTWPDEEKTAEAFAAWFLMPLRAVREAMRLAGVEAPRNGADVYQIARWLGTSYAGAVRHLVNVRLARPQQASSWSRLQPASLRRTAQGPADNPPGQVWTLRPCADGATAYVAAGDRLHLVLPAPADIAVPDGVVWVRGPEDLLLPDPLDTATGPLLQVTSALTSPGVVTARCGEAAGLWQIMLTPVPFRRGIAEAWRSEPEQRPPRPGADAAGAR